MGCANTKSQIIVQELNIDPVEMKTHSTADQQTGKHTQQESNDNHGTSQIKKFNITNQFVSKNGNEIQSKTEEGVGALHVIESLHQSLIAPARLPKLAEFKCRLEQGERNPIELPRLPDIGNTKEIVFLKDKEIQTDDETRDTSLDIGHSCQDNSDPPILPSRPRRDVAVPSPEYFEAIDNHALKTPKSEESSLNVLAKYLIRPARNDLEKVRALFRWITLNIRYDTEILPEGSSARSQDAESVLMRRTAMSEGYSNLFLLLCWAVKIPCKKISGFTKALRYDPEKTFTDNSNTDHTWNIVYVDSAWWPIDVTLAAGNVDKQTHEFNPCFTDFYFLTDPEDFVIQNFPHIDKGDESSSYQLLEYPLSIEEFDKATSLTHYGIEWGVQSSQLSAVLDCDGTCEIQVTATKIQMKDIYCDLTNKNTGEDFSAYGLLRKMADGSFSVKLTPPETGKYDLTLYGKVEQSDSENKAVMTYIIMCHSVMKNVVPYPEHSGSWGIKVPFDSYGFQSDTGDIDVVTAKAGRAEIKFKVSADINISFNLQHSQDKRHDLDQYYMAYIKNGLLKVKFRFPLAGYFIFRIFGKSLKKESVDHVGDILIICKDALHHLLPYPKRQGILGLKTDSKNYGIVSTSHCGEEIAAVNGQTEMKFKVNMEARVSFKVEHAETRRSDLSRFVFAFIEDDCLIIRCRLPVPGYYNLTMFARHIAQNNHNNDIIGKFLLSCSDPCMDQRPYPAHWGVWGAKPIVMEYGFTSEIFNHTYLTATNGEVSISLPVTPSAFLSFRLFHATENIPDIGRLVFSHTKSDILHVSVRLPRAGFYKLIMFGRRPDVDTSGALDHIAAFLLESKVDVENLQPYPVIYNNAMKYGLSLLEPLNGNIPANRNVRIKIVSESSMRITVNKQVFMKGDNNEFDVNFRTPGVNESVVVYRSTQNTGGLDKVYEFICI